MAIHFVISPGHDGGSSIVRPSRERWYPAGLLNPFNAGVQRVLCMPGDEEHRKVRLRRRKSHARFDEGGMVEAVMVRIVRHRRTKGAETDRPNLKPHRPALYSTLYLWIFS